MYRTPSLFASLSSTPSFFECTLNSDAHPLINSLAFYFSLCATLFDFIN